MQVRYTLLDHAGYPVWHMRWRRQGDVNVWKNRIRNSSAGGRNGLRDLKAGGVAQRTDQWQIRVALARGRS